MWNEMSNNDELQADPVFANSFLATTTSTVTTTPGPAPHQRRGPASPRPPRVPCDSPTPQLVPGRRLRMRGGQFKRYF